MFMIKRIITKLNSIVPKGKLIIFNSYPDLSGNPFALFRYICEERIDILRKYKIIWTTKFDTQRAKKVLAEISNDTIKVYKKNSIFGIFNLLRAEYIITSHNYITGIYGGRNQKQINLWHGMPFKTIGNMIQNGGIEDKIQGDVTIATSPIFQELMSRSFGINKDSVLVTGQPCTDSMFFDSDVLIKLGINRNEYKTIMIWMPTYRKSVVGALHQDGDINAFGPLDIISKHIDEVNEKLRSREILMLIKPHPMDVLCKIKMPQVSNIRVIHNSDLERENVELYNLLGHCDVLLTDYSSVYIDYLILDRPMAFVCSDIMEYSKSRGFCFIPPRDYLPGELITNYEEFILYISNMEVINSLWEKKRREICRLFDTYTDGKSSKRLCSYLWPNSEM